MGSHQCGIARARLRPRLVHHLSDRFNEVFRNGRTCEPCVASSARPFIAMAETDVGCEDDHRRRSEFRTPFQLGAQLPSGHVRKTQIDHDAIRGVSEGGGEGILTTSRDMNVNAMSFQSVLVGVGMIPDGGGEQNVCRVRHPRVLPGAVNAPRIDTIKYRSIAG